MRGHDEGMWTNGHPFIRLSGTPVVAGTVSADSFVSVGGQRTISCWNSCFESNDRPSHVFKEYETTLILKGEVVDDYFCLRLF
jgi:hypothetical protein